MFPQTQLIHILQIRDPWEKCQKILDFPNIIANNFCEKKDFLNWQIPDIHAVGRPEKPILIHPSKVPRRSLGKPEGRIALIHAVAHIEFNAINLALDAACRFAEMPPEYYADWISVAQDEARHFLLLSDRLEALDAKYGDLPAHDGLWEAAQKTAHDVLARMALVPRVLEARGLDVTPNMIEKLHSVGDAETVACLEVILAEEVRHVAIGTRWFRYVCAERNLEPDATFFELLMQYYKKMPTGPFNWADRMRAGFSESERERLEMG